MSIFIYVEAVNLTVRFDGCKYEASVNGGVKYSAPLLSQLIEMVPANPICDYWLHDFEYSV